jgi:hypothetical protein
MAMAKATPRVAGKQRARRFQVENMDLFTPGKHRDHPYTSRDFKDIATNFERFSTGESPLHHVPIVLGHDEEQELLEREGLPSAAWAKSIHVAPSGMLQAHLDEMHPEVARLVEGKAYRKVSPEIYDYPPEGVPGDRQAILAELRRRSFDPAQALREARVWAVRERRRQQEDYELARRAGVRPHDRPQVLSLEGNIDDRLRQHLGPMVRRIALLGADIPQDRKLADIPTPTPYSERFAGGMPYLLRFSERRCIRCIGPRCYAVYSEVVQMSREEMLKALTAKGIKPETLASVPDAALAEWIRSLDGNEPMEDPAQHAGPADAKPGDETPAADAAPAADMNAAPDEAPEGAPAADAPMPALEADAPESADAEEMPAEAPEGDGGNGDLHVHVHQHKGDSEDYSEFDEDMEAFTERDGDGDGDGITHEEEDHANLFDEEDFAEDDSVSALTAAPHRMGGCSSHEEYAEKVEAQIAKAEKRLARIQKFAEARERQEKKALQSATQSRIDADNQARIADGRVTPAELDAGKWEHLYDLPAHSVRKYSEKVNGKTVTREETPLDRALRKRAEGPVLVRMGEKTRAGKPGKTTHEAAPEGDADPEVQKLETTFKRYAETFKRQGTTLEALVSGYQAIKQRDPEYTAAKHLPMTD